jgi:hypothetical protein
VGSRVRYTYVCIHVELLRQRVSDVFTVRAGMELESGRRGFIPGRDILKDVIFVIIND